METFYLILVLFLFVLAVFDLSVGVSNDAVNFLNSAIGSKAASFKVIMAIAALGILVGAALSNGMMDIARHGIYQPQHFYFNEIMCILVAVMLTDVVLLDIFNSLGMPTSTTVSMVFELLGGTVAYSLVKIANDPTQSLGDLMNTDKALTVILAIFLSVAIAFFFGLVVQYISRLLFTFNFKKQEKYYIAVFGGLAATSIVYFMLIKGLKGSSIDGTDFVQYIETHTDTIVWASLIFFTILMQVLHWLKVNVFKIIILMGTFALALAFAGNDLVNFIGVPLAGYSSYCDLMAQGGTTTTDTFLMTSLLEPAQTPWYFLIGAGVVMVIALLTSKKAHNVVKTSLDLSRQSEGEESFGTSPVARVLVRSTTNMAMTITSVIPEPVKVWLNKRFDSSEMIMENKASFDLVRASVNVVLSGLLIAVGTSLKLPLSTTYVAFMVAMGSSLADRAWGRESAVFRITGVLSVIGGWFITAFVAFIVCALVTLAMYLFGAVAMVLLTLLAVVLLVRSNLSYSKKLKEEKKDSLFHRIVTTKDKAEVWALLKQHVTANQVKQLEESMTEYDGIVDGITGQNLRLLRRTLKQIGRQKEDIRKNRQLEMVGLRRIDHAVAIEHNTWFHLSTNAAQQIMYCLRRMADPCKEHVDNNFTPLPPEYCHSLQIVRAQVDAYLRRAETLIRQQRFDDVELYLSEVEDYKGTLSALRKELFDQMQDEQTNLRTSLVYLNILQESQEMLSSLRHLVRGSYKFVH